MDTHIYSFQIRVLIYPEDGQIAAHALELDLIGYGKTEKAAVEALHKIVDCQISFAREQNDSSILPFPAPKEFFARWEKAYMSAFKKEIMRDKSAQLTVRAIYVPLPKKEHKSNGKRFEPIHECA